MIKLDSEVLEYKESIKNLRREFHQIPESGFEVYKTREKIIKYLKERNIEVFEKFGKTAVIGFIKINEAESSIAFRADMDALSIEEQTSHDFKSNHSGMMHACGHDGHMATLLTFADFLCKNKKILKNNILLIFQPAEEGPGGAEIIVNENVLEKFNVLEIYGMHLYPNVEEGMIAVKSGPLMAQNGEFDIEIIGQSAHGAQPHNGIDSIVAAADLIMKVQTILPRYINPIEPGVVTIGKITGGERCNVISKRVLLEGTIRTFSAEVFDKIKEKLSDFALSIKTGYGCDVELVFRDMYPAVINDDKLYTEFVNAVGSENIYNIEPQMLAEDFSFYQKRVPGVFFFLGTMNKRKGFVFPLHHGSFDFDEDVLLYGVQAYVNILKLK